MYWLESNLREQKGLIQPSVTPYRKKGLLLIDDDEWFRSLFRLICEAQGIPVTAYSSLADMSSFASLQDYDVVILDYYLESFKGPEIAEYIDVFFDDLPVVVISGADISATERQTWPRCIRNFQCKSEGAHSILETALELLNGNCRPKAQAANLN